MSISSSSQQAKVHPVDAGDEVIAITPRRDAAAKDAPLSAASCPSALGSNVRKRRHDHVVDDTIIKVQTRAHLAELPEKTDPTVDIFIKAKLREWDQDQSGTFNRDEVESAMEELRQSMADLAKLKWQVIICTVSLTIALFLGLGAAAIAYALAKNTSVSGSGTLQEKGSGNSIVTTVQSGVGDLPSVLSFDDVSDNWTIDDAGLRDLDAISFTATNGTFYHFKVAELRRFDSGPQGSTDQLDIVTDGGHQLRFIEDVNVLEVKWKGTPQWIPIETSTSSRVLEAAEMQSMGEEEEDLPQPGGSAERPPARLLSKGHYVGGVFVRSRGGHYSCDPQYIDGYHDPELYCDGATRFGHFL